MTARVAVLVVILSAGVTNLAWQQQTFRTTVGGVLIDAAVMSGGKAVEGLTARDFEVQDNGVTQQIEVVSAADALLDFTLLLDYARGTVERMTKLEDGLAKVIKEFRPRDRLQLIACGQSVREIVPMQPVSNRINLEPLRTLTSDPQYTSTMGDCLVEALVLRSPPDRRHAIIAFSAAHAGHNVLPFPGNLLVPVARSTNATLFIGAIPFGGTYPPYWFQSINDAVSTTGGELLLGSFSDAPVLTYRTRGNIEVNPVEGIGTYNDIVKAFGQIVEDFRRRYVISYTIRGVPTQGWHDVSVKVTRPTSKPYVVRARKGYFGS